MRRISSLLGGPHAGNDGNENGGTRRGLAKGQIRARHEDSPKGGEFRAWHGFAADTRVGIFENGTGLRRAHQLGIFENGTGLRRARRLGIFERVNLGGPVDKLQELL